MEYDSIVGTSFIIVTQFISAFDWALKGLLATSITFIFQLYYGVYIINYGV